MPNKSTPASAEEIRAQYERFILEKMEAGIEVSVAELIARNQVRRDHGHEATENALAEFISTASRAALNGDPLPYFSGPDSPLIPNPTKEQT